MAAKIPHNASGPRNPGRPRHRRQRWWRWLIVALVIVVLVGAWLVPHAIYETSHDLPNPYWGIFGRSYTYTPEKGPPGPGLVDTRPDVVLLEYISDYLRVAGTYPCVADPQHYLGSEDPVLDGKPCLVKRPVTSVRVTSVSVGYHALDADVPYFSALVSLQVTYADSSVWSSQRVLRPERTVAYWLTKIHAGCWGFEAIFLYPKVVTQVPQGIAYYPKGATDLSCVP